jgi:spermidine/putrescine ABC transporter ATP-binding subunit
VASVVLADVAKRFDGVAAVHDLSLEVRDGELLTLLGPSGCGKTSTLRIVAGLLQPERGRVLIGGRNVTRVPPERREVGMVFQDYALFPHLTVAENVAFGLRERAVPAGERERRVREMLGLVRLEDQARKFPHQLSGGQRQRVALARAVAYPPQVLLMDEPLGALDLKLRQTMQIELARIQRALRITTLYVTHDQEEALNLSDRIAVMDRGHLVQLGTGTEVYDRPATPFVADFLGRVNLVRGVVVGREGAWTVVRVEPHRFRIPGAAAVEGAEIVVGVRPERVRLLACADPPALALTGEVERVAFVGNLVRYYVRCAGDLVITAEDQDRKTAFTPGQRVALEWDPDAVMTWSG